MNNRSELHNLELHNIFIPATIPSKKLMIILHGRGDSSEGFLGLPNYFNFDDMNYLLLDAPFEYYGGFSWYSLPPKQLPGIEYSAQVLTSICDSLFAEQFDIAQSFLFGFSQGSLMTFEFGTRYKDAFRGYIAISGYIYDAKKVLKELNPKVNQNNWLSIHGEFDGVLDYKTSKEQIEYLQDNDFQITFKSFEKDHEIIQDELSYIKEWIIRLNSK